MTVKWKFEDYWQGQSKTVTFGYTGAAQDFLVPDTTTVLQATLVGGNGGGESVDPVASGGRLVVQFPVTPGETLHIYVGGDGGRAIPTGTAGGIGGWNGGGAGGTAADVPRRSAGYAGGGATDIRQGGTDLAHRIAVAGAGGGNSGEYVSLLGGLGGADIGMTGRSFAAGPTDAEDYYGGTGGTQTAGGTSVAGGATAGSLGQGGTGADSPLNGPGGGGGGLYGGAGGSCVTSGASSNAGGGGGGSNGVGTGVTILDNSRGSYYKNPAPATVQIEYTQDADVYVMEINPNDGGSLVVTKNINIVQNTGPNRVNILQEGQSQAPLLDFSGVILTQAQFEAMEQWYDRRTLIKLTDDLGREYYGVFSKWAPKRTRRASNFWYHTYDAEFTVNAYRNSSGAWVYGRVS